MTIHVVTPGQSLAAISGTYGVPAEFLAAWNGLKEPDRLAVGQSLLVLTPTEVYTVQLGDTLFSVAARAGVGVRRLYQLNPQLGGLPTLIPGQRLCLSIAEEPDLGPREAFGYAYPFVNEATLRGILPCATDLMPFTYGISDIGGLVPLNDDALLALADEYAVRPMLHLSTITESGTFSSQRAEQAVSTAAARQRLIEAAVQTMTQKGYRGVDVDFEYIEGQFAQDYATFVAELRTQVNALGGEVFAALAPKTAVDQRGLLYEGHDYASLGAAADAVLLMTYEWGYSFSPPMAVAPIDAVRRVVSFAVNQIRADKIFLGFPAYGYDWTLPYERSRRARVIGCDEAVQLALRHGAEIQFDERAQTPFFRYRAQDGTEHECWFEDARSAMAKYDLLAEFGLRGVGFWNYMRPFAAGYTLLAARAVITQL